MRRSVGVNGNSSNSSNGIAMNGHSLLWFPRCDRTIFLSIPCPADQRRMASTDATLLCSGRIGGYSYVNEAWRRRVASRCRRRSRDCDLTCSRERGRRQGLGIVSPRRARRWTGVDAGPCSTRCGFPASVPLGHPTWGGNITKNQQGGRSYPTMLPRAPLGHDFPY